MMQISQNKPMEHFISGFMEKYRAKGEKYSGQDPAAQFVTKDAADFIRQTQIVDENEYEIYGRCAQGNWAYCPYVDIMSKKFKDQGVCIAYILSYNCNAVYLTLNQIVDNIGKKELQKRVTEVLTVLGEDTYGFHRGNEGVDFASKSDNPEKYKEATILYKKYEAGNVPDESTLYNDLANLMELYRRWINHCEKAQQVNAGEESKGMANTAIADLKQNSFVSASKIDIELIMRDRKASAVYDTDTNITTILAGSQWASNPQPSLPKSAKKWRDDIQKNGIVDSFGRFTKEQKVETNRAGFTSLSPAASIITGGSESGMGRWTLKDGTPIGEYLKSIGVLDDKGHYISPENRKTLAENEPEVVVEADPQDMSSNEAIQGYLQQNVIFYGVPGCGKSYFIKNLLKVKDDDGKIIDMPRSYYKRILFHPEYSYSDFVGQLRPEVGDDNKITYKFVPGPFTEILLDAYKDREHDYFLIIEEINRGNAPAIFGDLFQLLDRKDGVSEYSIDNKDILDYFERELEIARESEKDDISAMAQAVETIKREGVRIPENLTIFATMNTCDQNVFTLDTAFKRRWRMSRIENKFDSILSTWKIQFENGKDVSWKDFAEKVNDAILNNCNDGTAAEDKQLGAFFVKENDKNVRRFAEKVLLYLWDDVAKYDKSQLFDTKNYKTLDMVIDGFAEGENVFSPNCAKLQELYNNMKQPKQTDNNAAGVPSGAAPGTDSSVKNAATDEEQGRE